jgi:hypothetical protein
MKASLCACFSWGESDGAWHSEFWNRTDFVDPGGHLLDQSKSKLGLSSVLWVVHGAKRQKASESPPILDKFEAKIIHAEMHYTFGGEPKSVECVGEGLKQMRSSHFSIDSPGAWQFRGRAYLACLEKLRTFAKENTSRRGPASFNVDWRSNPNNAKSIVGSVEGGAKDLWMSFPLWTLEAYEDPFAEPTFQGGTRFVGHEILHGFGYNHGPEMGALQDRSQAQYSNLRWKSVETGIWAVWPD